LFLRDKKYADFRTDPEHGLDAVITATAKFTNPTMGRVVEGDEYFIDWAYDWGYLNGDFFLQFVIIQHSKLMPYTVLSHIHIVATPEATKRYRAYARSPITKVMAWSWVFFAFHGALGVGDVDMPHRTKLVNRDDPERHYPSV
jgi:hypothetical protein